MLANVCSCFYQQSNITTLKTAILANVTETRLAEIWLKLINQLIEDLTK